MEAIEVSSCCCCLGLREGCIAIAVFDMLIYITLAGLCGAEFHRLGLKFDEHVYNYPEYKLGILIACLGFVACVLLLVAVLTRFRPLILVYLIMNYVVLLLGVSDVTLFLQNLVRITHLHNELGLPIDDKETYAIQWSAASMLICVTFLKTYFHIVVSSFYKKA